MPKLLSSASGVMVFPFAAVLAGVTPGQEPLSHDPSYRVGTAILRQGHGMDMDTGGIHMGLRSHDGLEAELYLESWDQKPLEERILAKWAPGQAEVLPFPKHGTCYHIRTDKGHDVWFQMGGPHSIPFVEYVQG